MSFIDTATVKVQAGNGGNGVVSFRHEIYVDRGGPDGGDGGKGGDVVFVADRNVNTLGNFRHKQIIAAKDGNPGFKAKRHGRNGEDLRVLVPIGTQIQIERDSGELVLLGDLYQDAQELIVANGGKGGFGNAHFTSSRRQAPHFAEKGVPGERYQLKLELKLLADVGLIGLPNAGKSTLLSVISNAKPEIANYPFTTLTPNLGVADVGNDSLLVADIPGLIEGASKGKGLGDAFLRHVERTAVLVHLVDAYSTTISKDYKTILKELAEYVVDLSERPQIVVLSKTDGLSEKQIKTQLTKLEKASNQKVFVLSSLTKTGVNELLKECLKVVKKHRKTEIVPEVNDDIVRLSLDASEGWRVEKTDEGTFIVHGEKIKRFAIQTEVENEYAVQRLTDIMGKMGIMHELERMGYERGSTVQFSENGPTIKI